MKKVKAQYKAVYEPIGDLVTYRAFPTEKVSMNLLNPFIFLNHHGYQEYHPHNNGLPFGPHPHRGFETVTFIIDGDLVHKDSSGMESIIKAGGVQWMTAGSGLIHAEVSSEEFKAKGGPLEILQLWVNLPAQYKMTAPNYIGLQENEIPKKTMDDGKVRVDVVSGQFEDMQGAIKPLTDITLTSIYCKEGCALTINVPEDRTIFFYVVRGEVVVNNESARIHHLVVFEKEGTDIQIKANTDALILFGHAAPLNEPIEAYGPFVMNTPEEIQKAFSDYRAGKFGKEDL